MASDVAPFPDFIAGRRAALDSLSPHASPCSYLVPAKWAAIRESGIEFCDRLGTEAHRLGWTAAELFAVHPEHGTARIDACGVLMIGPEPARGVEANRVRFERTSGHRNGRGWV